jgi:hypothetical protein
LGVSEENYFRNSEDLINELQGFQDRIVEAYGTAAQTIAGLFHFSESLKKGINAATERGQDPKELLFFVGHGDPNDATSRAQYWRTFEQVIRDCSAGGPTEKMLRDFPIVFIHSIWEHEVRPKLALLKKIELNDVKSEAFGDLTTLRNCVLHKKGILQKDLIFFDIFQKGDKVMFDGDSHYLIF